MNLFDAIYVINLPTRPDRRREMIEQLRLAGVDPASPRVHFFDAFRPADAGSFPTVGTRGCFMSHLGVLKQALAHGHERTLILEDDANFVRHFPQAFAQVEPRLVRDDWGMAYLAALEIAPPLPAAGDAVREVAPEATVLGAHMFAVRREILADLVRYLEAMLQRPAGDPAGGPMHVDGAYGWFRRAHPAVRTFACVPELGYQRPSRTDIHALRWFDRVPLLRDAVQGLRRARAVVR